MTKTFKTSSKEHYCRDGETIDQARQYTVDKAIQPLKIWLSIYVYVWGFMGFFCLFCFFSCKEKEVVLLHGIHNRSLFSWFSIGMFRHLSTFASPHHVLGFERYSRRAQPSHQPTIFSPTTQEGFSMVFIRDSTAVAEVAPTTTSRFRWS